jgi:hypothetical protein
MRPVAVLSLLLLAAACSTKEPDLGYRAVNKESVDPKVVMAKTPPMDPSRKVLDADCTQPIALDQGNLRCR